MTSGDPSAVLAGDRGTLARAGTAERVAQILRQRITEGVFLPGTRLSEPAISGALGVSRNTLREAFQLLAHERLAVRELNRGVFVSVLTAPDIEDLYRIRRMVECAAVREAADREDLVLTGLEAALAEGKQAALDEDWRAVGTASIRWHQALCELSGSDRVAGTMRQVLAETRLFFVLTESTQAFFEPYLARHEKIIGHLRRRRFDLAEQALERYLRDAERQLLAAYHRRETR
ncbi:GntR family transcriptional regulator [Amycolatopsis albispora]|uniref:GntR family transcriptional regulator n=1 Tax=Amycolatopsis albispora TaxID=1804986 RepID=A0A344LA83_9PSEU|nr:GntR family transcriptional regulator [Amycolatopsis albispora]AXB44957.1 GntR family transcriptional regulator [Amycolatopsis albispora]